MIFAILFCLLGFGVFLILGLIFASIGVPIYAKIKKSNWNFWTVVKTSGCLAVVFFLLAFGISILSRGLIAGGDDLKDWQTKADNGDAEAQEQLGIRYECGYDDALDPCEDIKDYAKAMVWYRKAADQGYYHAMNDIGEMYEKGEGVAKDDQMATEWHDKATAEMRRQAEQGDTKAEGDLGQMYYSGAGGIKQDNATAIQLWRTAANQGDVEMQGLLGDLYKSGQGGLKIDYAEAYFWKSLADKTNSLSQNRRIVLRSKDAVANLAKNITPEQRLEVDKRVSAWKPVPKSQSH